MNDHTLHKLLLCHGFVLVALLSFGQRDAFIRYNALIDRGRTAIARSEFQRATAYFDTAFSVIPWSSWEYSDAVLAALRAEQQEIALKFLVQGARDLFRRRLGIFPGHVSFPHPDWDERP